MARPRSEHRERAFAIYLEHEGKIKLKDIADQLGIPDSRVRKWKAEDKWEQKLKGALLNSKGSAPKRKGAPKGNQNAKGNRGGNGAPKGNRHAEKHGFFSRIFPDDEETLAIIEEIQVKSPIEILWEQIVIQYTAIARAQKLMFVRDQEDKTIEKVGYQEGNIIGEKWEVQQAWDKHANFLQAQSRAIKELTISIEKYEKLLLQDLATEEQKLRIEKFKAEIAKLKGDDGEIEDDGFLEALEGNVKEVWADEEI